jgi:hypothetical protein
LIYVNDVVDLDIIKVAVFFMLRFEKVFKDERMMRGLTGLNLTEFETLLATFSTILLEIQSKKNRQRAVGGGCKGILCDARSKLFFILFYMKAYPTFDVAAFVFGTVRSVTFEWKSKLLPVLERALGRVVSLLKRQVRSVEEFLQLFPEVKDVFVDGTERPVQRPRKSKNLRRKYSGKKKKHTHKNTVLCDENSRILAVSPTKGGRIHDSKQLRKSGLIEQIPKDVAIWADKAYPKNLAKNGNTVMIPHKKPRKGELSKEQKAENRVISGLRMVVEHAIGGIKRFRCLTDTLRNKNGDDDEMIVVASALWNLHLICNK